MNNKLFSLLAAVLLGAVLTGQAVAQQLYITKTMAKYEFANDPYCAGSVSPNNVGSDVSFVTNIAGIGAVDPHDWSAKIEWEHPRQAAGPTNVYPGGCLKLCATISCVSTGVGTFGIDKLEFEVFKFGSGANPLDPASTPPIRTIAMSNITQCPGYQSVAVNIGTFCTAWDGSYNLDGIFGKTNGQFGFRAKVETNQVSPTAGNISITQTVAYPGETQYPLSVDVVNVHTVKSTPTVVGRITGVAAQPYNLLYRLSKDANVTIHIHPTDDAGVYPSVRTIVDDLPRVGEGVINLTNGDFWDGRDDEGAIVSPGVYIAYINAKGSDYFGLDTAYGATAYMSVNPLQVTDVAIKPLGATATDQAIISCMLTEAATVYVGIYPPGTTFASTNVSVPVPSAAALRTITEQKDRRVPVSVYWDGKDNTGRVLPDADYVYAIWADMPTSATWGGLIGTQDVKTGIVPVARGLLTSFISPTATVMGSSPSVAGLDPFYFSYTPVRSALFSMNILPDGSTTPIRHLIINQPRYANFTSREVWDGKSDIGLYVPSGKYWAELIGRDSLTAGGVSTTTVQFMVDMFHILDVRTTPLLGETTASATISFEMSQPMFMDLKVYPTNVTIVSSATVNPADWPLVSPAYTLVYGVSGVRPGRFRITEYWDGRNTAGVPVPDGRYPFSLTARSSGTAQVMYAAERIYGYIDVAKGQIVFMDIGGGRNMDIVPNIPTLYNSSETVTLPPYEIDYVLSRQAHVRVEILRQSDQETVAVVVPADPASVDPYEFREGGMPIKEFWDGRCTVDTAWCANNDFVTGGAYDVRIVAHDIATWFTSPGTTVQQTVDVHPLRIFDMAITPMTPDTQAAGISYQVSEPMTVVTKIYRPGTSLANCANLYEVKDGCAANLVKMFAGVRPARTLINEYWDGTDRTLSKEPDGNYVFKVYGSTSTNSVSTLTGQLSIGANRVEDVIVSNLPVVNGPTANDAQLEADTFFYPNPYTGVGGKFHLPIYTTSEVTIKIYNLAGDLVWTYASGVQGSGQDLLVPWPKINDSGNTVVHGVYFAVIRYEGREGGRGELQLVKKILIP